MSSSYKRGNQYEGEVRKILEAQGWKVEGQHRRVMYMNGKMLMVGRDIFGCDLIAKKAGEPTLWIQVSTVEQKSKKFKQITADFVPSVTVNGKSYERVQFWGRIVGQKKFRVFDYPSGVEQDTQDCVKERPCKS